ncbi:DinB family protein [Rossellomorea aquimaris]|uniref:DinB family protein n=1 Tax=Rossellomorea aquimaris TaxID=189382 RepID=UPI001CD745BD|nr:DinB family protein [Rossellomorea aquimaris]MCA1054454.1 DinB family protein [Rossellomorea aquimaris]
MEQNSIFLIKEKNGLKKDFSLLVSMMDYARHTTLQEVQGLSVEELDYRIHDEANSIGMLLAHFDAVEKIYQALTFEDMSDDEVESYADTLEPALSLGKAGEVIKGKEVTEYLDTLSETRSKTISHFRELPEDWLYEETDWWYGEKGNNFFKWFHVFEDEINHRGQIRMIKKLHAKTLEQENVK